jgi:aquaporin Z
MYTNFGGSGFSVGLTVMMLVYTLGPISGAHVNPAVSTTIFLTKNIDVQSYGVYVVCQLLAACVGGALLFLGILGDVPEGGAVGGGDFAKALLAEFLFTLMLCEVVLHTAVAESSQGRQYAGMAIGFVILIGAVCVGSISGGAFNPAVTTSLLFQSKSFPWAWFASYIAVQLLAASLAAFLFKLKMDDLGSVSVNELVRKVVAEFLGTFWFLLAICLSPSGTNGLFIVGAVLSVLVFTYAKVSGSHFNPAVSLAMLVDGQLKVVEFFSFVCTQLVSAVLAFGTAQYLQGGDWKLVAGEGTVLWHELVAEVFGTFVLVFTILNVTKSEYLSEVFGWAIGVAVMAGAGAEGSVSGGSLNPSITFASAVGYRAKFFDFMGYVVAELVGSLVAWLAFKCVNLESFSDLKSVNAREFHALLE